MDSGWIEFFTVVVCGLVGFFGVNAFLEYRRANNKAPHQERAEAGSQQTQDENRPKDEPGSRSSSTRTWWEILGVSSQASPDDIKTAFRNAIARYHPDRVEGLGRELRELAEQKAKEINCAYAAAKRERRFS